MELENESIDINQKMKPIDLLSNDSILEEVSKVNQTEENAEELSSDERTEKEKEHDSDSQSNISHYKKNKNKSKNKNKNKKGGKEEEEEELVIRYFTPREVAEHNTCDDLWVSWLGNVYDLTSLALEHRGKKKIKNRIKIKILMKKKKKKIKDN